MASTALGYEMFDADQHYYETEDAFTRHLPDEFARRLYWTTSDRGHRKLIIDGQVYEYIANPTFDPISVPGSLVEMYRNEKSREELAADPLAGERVVAPLSRYPEFQDRDQRAAKAEEHGLAGCLLFPTLVNGVEELTKHDHDLTYAVFDGFNRWISEEWPFGYRGLLWSAPIVTFADPARAVTQVDAAASNGARAVIVRAAPVLTRDGYRSPGDTGFDAVWQRICDHDLAVITHSADSGYRPFTDLWRADVDRQSKMAAGVSTFEMINGAEYGRGISDWVGALIVHGVFTRFPRLRVLSVENGSNWVAWLQKELQVKFWHFPGRFNADPVQQFRTNIWLSPYWEEDIPALTEYMPVERICAGSDWPHPEGLPEPTEFIDGVKTFTPDEQRRIMRDNATELLGL